MSQIKVFLSARSGKSVLAIAIISILFFASILGTAAQSAVQVQKFTGNIPQNGGAQIYALENLEQGRKLFVHVQGISGNFDPFVALLRSDQQLESIAAEFNNLVEQATQENRDPLLLISEVADQNFLAWDDDSGGGFAAAFEYTIPTDGDYQIAVFRSPFTESFGDFNLLLGLDAPLVLSGSATLQGEAFAVPVATTANRTAVQEVSSNLTDQVRERVHRLQPFEAGETLYVYAETTSGNLIPQVVLQAYGAKPIRSANIAGKSQQATLEYTFPSDESEYLLEISSPPGSVGEYHLLVGRNEPAVLNGQAEIQGARLVNDPFEVSIGVKLQQIANIDQKAENYSAVVSMRMNWNDPALAFRADECQCEFKTYVAKDFVNYVTQEKITWPAYTYLNQQNNRWIQNDYVVVYPNGDAIYFERFTTNFQAPDFDFRKFPFDTQTFYIRIDSLYGSSFVKFIPSDYSEVGTQLGEEEWYVTDFETEVVTEPSSAGNETSNFVFRFYANRHLSFYIFRIFVPLILIITVAWITFFLQDYGKRVDATTANLLLFIAFNFTIAGELPRLGYLTYMDCLLVGAFFISVLIVIYNVYLKRMEKNERQTWAQKIDKYMIWLYPLGYLLAFLGITWNFFWR